MGTGRGQHGIAHSKIRRQLRGHGKHMAKAKPAKISASPRAKVQTRKRPPIN